MGYLGSTLRPGLEYQIRVVENTVTTDAKGREGGGFDHNIIMMLNMQCGIWQAPLSLQHFKKDKCSNVI